LGQEVTIHKGDKVKANNYPGVWTVSMVEGDEAWCKSEKFNHLTFALSSLTKVPDFFEVGKTYKNTSSSITFDCHYIGQICGTLSGCKYAAGQISQSYRGSCAVIKSQEDFQYWTEI
jgi:hypothetical protein